MLAPSMMVNTEVNLMAKDLLISWLNDAYAMERALLPVLENHAKDAESAGMREAGVRIREHIEETKKHADRVEQCLKVLGTTPSAAKSAFGSILGSGQSVMTGLFSDEAVKNALLDFGTEEFEVACYRALAAAADELNEKEIALLCEDNLHEDRMMATWIEDHIPDVIAATLAKKGQIVR